MTYGVRGFLQDVFALAGIAAVGYGLWQMWPPLMWVWIGLALMAGAGLTRSTKG